MLVEINSRTLNPKPTHPKRYNQAACACLCRLRHTWPRSLSRLGRGLVQNKSLNGFEDIFSAILPEKYKERYLLAVSKE